MLLFSKCMCCLVNQQERLIENFEDEEKKTFFMREVMALLGNSKPEHNAPWMSALITEIREKYYGKNEKIAQMKQEFNQLLLQMEPELEREIKKSGDTLKEAIRMEDAKMTGITEEVLVITNNSSIQGVILSKLTKEGQEIFDAADVILAKGQGNFESLYGCGRNIYYLFLCKCQLFSKRFGVERFQGMFINEKRVSV